MRAEGLTQNQMMIRYLELSETLGYDHQTIGWIHFAIYTLCQRKREGLAGEQILHVTAREICVALIKDVDRLYDESIEDSLRSIKLLSSEDIGKIVDGLASKKLIAVSDDESAADYENIFSVDNIDAFLTEAEIRRRQVRFSWWYHKIMWTLYIVGFVIVVASYSPLVSSGVGWVGWVVGMIGFAMQFIKRPLGKRF